MTDDARRPGTARIGFLYFGGCPTYREAERNLSGILAGEGVRADVSLVAVNTDEEARRPRFPGSPTIRIDGRDLFPLGDHDRRGLACRVYPSQGGPKGAPTVGMLRAALGLTSESRGEGREDRGRT